LRAEEAAPKPKTAEQLTKSAGKSIVVVTVTGRGGQQQGLGSGFVVGKGLIATNLHVVGEARPIQVQFADGAKYDVKAIHASDRRLDLALLKIEATDRPILAMGDSDTLKQGQPVIALGNPQGLKHSVVTGTVSGRREIDGRNMIQLAIPIEPGNSGGPLLDMLGRVHGILTMKSAVTDNLGFAVDSNSLKPLLRKPNPIPIARWLTIGRLDPHDWKPLSGAGWKQRAGRISVAGTGEGFGGRALCLWQGKLPDGAYECAVTVRLDDESGAAGLAFASDGGDRHYGFYPSNGQMRLTRFAGPSVFTWKVLVEKKVEAYLPGEWNRLKVRVEKERILCYVNDTLVFESTDRAFTGGQAGLAKFRRTEADFRRFAVGKKLADDRLDPKLVARIDQLHDQLAAKGAFREDLVQRTLKEGDTVEAALQQSAKRLEHQAARLRELSAVVHQRRIHTQLSRVMAAKEDKIDLLHAGLLIARLDNAEVDVAAYLRIAKRMAMEIRESLDKNADEQTRLEALGKYLFEQNGFHGSRTDYYNNANSYINEVIDDREGLPITLSVLYIELARRLDVTVVGVGMPGHFICRHEPKKGKPQLVDPYDGGKKLSRKDAAATMLAVTGQTLQDAHLRASSSPEIVVRMLHNLLNLAQGREDSPAMLRYLDAILVVAPDSAQDRLLRSLVLMRLERKEDARRDVDWLLKNKPEGVSLPRLRQLRDYLDQEE